VAIGRHMTDGPHLYFLGVISRCDHAFVPMCQDPHEADPILKVQTDLDETKIVLVRPSFVVLLQSKPLHQELI